MQIVNVKLLTSCIDPLRSFYAHTLGLPLQSDSKDEFTVKAGKSSLTFVNQTDEDEPFYHFAFDIPNNKIDESIEWLISTGTAIQLLPNHQYKNYSDSWNSTSIYFYDPAGNIVEFIARHTLSNSSTAPFSSTDFLNISEIGLVVHDVPKAMDLLKTELNVKTYKYYNERFTPLGDESGLFILAAYNRVWFGSDKKAEIFKTEITLKGTPTRTLSIEEYPYHIFIK